MPEEPLMKVQLTEPARIAISSLGEEDRRLVHAWLDHLRNWRNDEFIRNRSKRLSSGENVFVFQTSTNLAIAFSLTDAEITVLSVFRKESLRAFQATLESSAS